MRFGWTFPCWYAVEVSCDIIFDGGACNFFFIYFHFGLYYSGQTPLKEEFTPVQPNFKP